MALICWELALKYPRKFKRKVNTQTAEWCARNSVFEYFRNCIWFVIISIIVNLPSKFSDYDALNLKLDNSTQQRSTALNQY